MMDRVFDSFSGLSVMNREPYRLVLILVGIFFLVLMTLAWVTQNPAWYFDKVLTVCGTVAALYIVAAVAMQLYATSQKKPDAKKKKRTPDSRIEREDGLSKDEEIIEVMDDEKPKRRGDSTGHG